MDKKVIEVAEKKHNDSKTIELNALNNVLSIFSKYSDSDKIKIIEIIKTFYNLSNKTSSFVDNNFISKSSSVSEIPKFSEDRSMTPKEFLRDKQPLTDVERVACLAYYLTHYRNQPHFKTLDISLLNTEAAQRKFSNSAKSVDNAMKYGYLAQASKGQKQISAEGELYVEKLPDRAEAKEIMTKFRKKLYKKSSNKKNSNSKK